MHEIVGVPFPYEDAFRVIGRHLDTEPAYFASILEVETGFTVRFQSSRHSDRVKALEFSFAKLRDLEVFQAAARGTRPRRSRHEGMYVAFPLSRQELLRAIGNMLDEVKASSVTVDELAEEIRVSYIRSVANRPLQIEKVALVLQSDTVQKMVARARARRGRSIEAGA